MPERVPPGSPSSAGDSRREGEHAAVGRRIDRQRVVRGRVERNQHARAPRRDEKAEHRAEERDNQALEQQQADDAAAARAEGQPQGELAVTGRATRESRFATLRHAMSSTPPATAIRICNGLVT